MHKDVLEIPEMQTMHVGTRPPATELPVAPQRLHRITLEEYDRLIATGFFGRSDRVVLLDGLLVDKRAKGPRHSIAVELSYRVMSALLPAGWHARQEKALALADGPEGYGSAPKPDLAIVTGPVRRYVRHHPDPGTNLDCRPFHSCDIM
jgi:hypothetical protein